MNNKQIKQAVKKNLKVAKAKSIELKKMAGKGYAQFKKDMNISPAKSKELEQKALKEYQKIKKQMETTSKKVESYIKKNPAKAAAISAGIGAALAGAAALMLSGGPAKKKPAKKVAKKR